MDLEVDTSMVDQLIPTRRKLYFLGDDDSGMRIPSVEEELAQEQELRDRIVAERIARCGHSVRWVDTLGKPHTFRYHCKHWREGCPLCLKHRANEISGHIALAIGPNTQAPNDIRFLTVPHDIADQILTDIPKKHYYKIPLPDGTARIYVLGCYGMGERVTVDHLKNEDWVGIAKTPNADRVSGSLGAKEAAVSKIQKPYVVTVRGFCGNTDGDNEDFDLAYKMARNEMKDADPKTGPELQDALTEIEERIISNLRLMGHDVGQDYFIPTFKRTDDLISIGWKASIDIISPVDMVLFNKKVATARAKRLLKRKADTSQ
jgi:hypothetical protein